MSENPENGKSDILNRLISTLFPLEIYMYTLILILNIETIDQVPNQ